MAPNPKNLSSFARSALALGEEFSQLQRLSGELERLPIDTDNGLEWGRLLLARFSECGQRFLAAPGAGIASSGSAIFMNFRKVAEFLESTFLRRVTTFSE